MPWGWGRQKEGERKGGGKGEGEREGERGERKYFEGMENGKEQQRQKSGKQGHTHSRLQTPAVSTWCGYYETFGGKKQDRCDIRKARASLFVSVHAHAHHRAGWADAGRRLSGLSPVIHAKKQRSRCFTAPGSS